MEKRTGFFCKTDKRYIAAAAGLFTAALFLQLAARQADGFAQWYTAAVYPVITAVWGGLWGMVPWSVSEIGIYLLILGFLVYGWHWRREWGRIAARALFTVCLLAFLYTADCGINYYSRPFSGYLALDVRASSVKELTQLCQYLTDRVNETVDETPYNGAWRKEARASMKRLGESYPVLGGYYPLPKPVLVSEILSVQQLSGIYSPFTVEANFNRDMTAYNIPLTMCHELSHLKGFMREDEANFIGYLACIGSKDRSFEYSGYLTGWIYASNALAKYDKAAYAALHVQLAPDVLKNLDENTVFWNRYDGKVAEAANKLNDAYLKLNDQKDGVQSYGRMVDLLLAYYREGR